MKDTFKEKVTSERASFEVYPLEEKEVGRLWDEIDKDLGDTGRTTRHGREGIVIRINPRPFLRVAASIAVIGLLGIAFLWIKGNVDQIGGEVSLRDLSPDLAETELYYDQLVTEKLQLIRASQNQIDPKIIENIQMLDSAYQELKNDLKDNFDNEEVIDAMIQNYRIRLQILEQILEDIQQETDDEISADVLYSI